MAYKDMLVFERGHCDSGVVEFYLQVLPMLIERPSACQRALAWWVELGSLVGRRITLSSPAIRPLGRRLLALYDFNARLAYTRLLDTIKNLSNYFSVSPNCLLKMRKSV